MACAQKWKNAANYEGKLGKKNWARIIIGQIIKYVSCAKRRGGGINLAARNMQDNSRKCTKYVK